MWVNVHWYINMFILIWLGVCESVVSFGVPNMDLRDYKPFQNKEISTRSYEQLCIHVPRLTSSDSNGCGTNFSNELNSKPSIPHFFSALPHELIQHEYRHVKPNTF